MLQPFLDYLSHERQYASLTVEAYHTDLQQAQAYLEQAFSLNLFDPHQVGLIKPRHIRAWMGILLDNQAASSTLRRKISALKRYFRFLQQGGYLTTNPAGHLALPKKPQALPAYLKEEEVQYMLDELDFPEGFTGYRDRLVLELLYGCGLRRAELLALTPQDLNLVDRLLKVKGKGGKERIIPFGKQVSASLEIYIIAAKKEGFSLDNNLIIRDNGLKAYPKLIYRIVRKYIGEASSLQQRSPHVLRHTYATHMLERGADLNAIKDLLGHSSLAATQVYTHQSLARLKAVHQQAHPRSEAEIE